MCAEATADLGDLVALPATPTPSIATSTAVNDAGASSSRS